jgi:hypothetical protein
LLGGLLWVLAADVRHYRALLLRLGAGIIFFGLVLLVVEMSRVCRRSGRAARGRLTVFSAW